MKKMLFTIFFMGTLHAQAQMKFGIQAGVLSSKIKVNGDATIDDYGGKPEGQFGFRAGVFAEVPLSGKLFFNPELSYVSNKGKYDHTTNKDGGSLKVVFDAEINYLELPLNMVYKVDLKSSRRILLGAGPTIGYKISEKTWTGVAALSWPGPGVSSTFFGLSSSDNTYKPLHIGANALIGYELPVGLRFSVQANHALSDLDKSDKVTTKNFYVAFNISYKF